MSDIPQNDALSAAMSQSTTTTKTPLRRALWRIFWTLLVIDVLVIGLGFLYFSGLANYRLP